MNVIRTILLPCLLSLLVQHTLAQAALPHDPKEEILPSQDAIAKNKVRSVTLKSNLVLSYEKKYFPGIDKPVMKIVYDTAGRVISRTWYEIYNTDANTIWSEEHIIYDEYGNPAAIQYNDGTRKHVNLYDSIGQLREVHSLWKDTLRGKIIYDYDANGRVKKKTSISLHSGDTLKETFSYDTSGNMISKGYNEVPATRLFVYDSQGRRLVESLDNLQTPVTRFRYCYNKNGWLSEVRYYEFDLTDSKKLYYSKKGLLKKLQEYSYDEKGNALKDVRLKYYYEFYP